MITKKINIIVLFVIFAFSSFLFSDTGTIQIISSINDSVYTIDSKIASIDDDIKLSIVFNQKLQNNIINYSPVENLSIVESGISNNDIVHWDEVGESSIKWYKIEEANGDYYSNTEPTWHWENIPYKETEIVEWRNQFIVTADVTPTVFKPVFCNGKITGTMRYKAVLNIDGDTFSTPGKDSKYRGSISNKVHRISLKGNTDSKIINFALAMCNLPYIWGSASFTGSKWDNHQAELFIGADCADFAVAAYQMAGYQLAYDSIKDRTKTKIIAKQATHQNGNYLDAQNDVIIVGENGIHPGDFVYWGKVHVGLYYEDKSDPESSYRGKRDGIFNKFDLVIHTLYAEPKIESISEIPDYGNLTIYQFKEN